MSDSLIEKTKLSSVLDHPSFTGGKRVKLELNVEHDRGTQTIVFTLDRHLPGEHGRDYFRYSDLIIPAQSAVKNPMVARCQTHSVRVFVNELAYERQLSIETFSLTQVVLRYGARLGYAKAVEIFVNACAKAFSLGENDAVVVLTPRG